MSCSELVTRDEYTQKLPTRAFLLYTYLAWTGEKRLVEIGRQKLALARLDPLQGVFFCRFRRKSINFGENLSTFLCKSAYSLENLGTLPQILPLFPEYVEKDCGNDKEWCQEYEKDTLHV